MFPSLYYSISIIGDCGIKEKTLIMLPLKLCEMYFVQRQSKRVRSTYVMV